MGGVINKIYVDDICEIVSGDETVYYSLDYMKSNYDTGKHSIHGNNITPLDEINKYKVTIGWDFMHKVKEIVYKPNMFGNTFDVHIVTDKMREQTIKSFDTITLYVLRESKYKPILRTLISPESVTGGKSLDITLVTTV